MRKSLINSPVVESLLSKNLVVERFTTNIVATGCSITTSSNPQSQIYICCDKAMCHIDASKSSSDKNGSNKNYEADKRQMFQYTEWLLKILGIWPLVTKNSSTAEKYISNILIVICPIVLAFTIVPASLHMILREKDLLVRLMLFGPVGFCFTNFLKYGFIVFHQKTIKLCVDHVETDWKIIETDNDREIMTRNAKAGRRLTIICGTFMYTGGMSYHTIMPLWSGSTINELNETVRPLVYPGFDIFVDPQTSPIYEIVFGVICVSAFVTYTVTTATCNLAALFVTHICGQIDIIISQLDNLVDGIDENCNSEKLQKRISYVIKSHVRVISLSSRVEEILREICLVEVVATTMTICLLEYYCITEWNNSETVAIITYLVLLISLSFNIFIFCHIGELLKKQYHEVGRATYMMEWYKLPGKTGLALVMIISMANYPRKLTAGGMMELTVCSFGNIIKTSLVYLNMLRTVAE